MLNVPRSIRFFLIMKSSIYEWRIKGAYFKDWSNYMEIPMYILSIAFVSVFQDDCLCPSRDQWRAGIVAVFFAWIILILFFNKWPTLGVYIEMFKTILLQFLGVAIVGFLLIVAFGLAFYMTFYEPELPVSFCCMCTTRSLIAFQPPKLEAWE